MRNLVGSLALSMSLCLATPALSLTIDSFETGDFSVTDVAPGPSFGQNAAQPTTDVIGAVRLVRSNATNGGTTTNALTTTGGPDSAVAGFSDAVPPIGQGDIAYIYDGIADSSANGQGGVLNVDLSAFLMIDVESYGTPSTVSIQLTLWDAVGSQSSALTPNVNGITSFLLSSFGLVDLTDINTIRVAVLDLDPGESIEIAHISAEVPEPTTGLLFAIGLLGLGLRKARSH
jgi:PEP-CTERM motif